MSLTGDAHPELGAPPAYAAEVFAELEPELGALDADELLEPNLAIPDAAARAVAVAPTILAWLPTIEAWLPRHPIEPLRRIDKYAVAMWYAHVRATTRSERDLSPLVEEAKRLQQHLLGCARLLQARGARIELPRVGRGRRAYLALAGDLVHLAGSLGEHHAALGALGPTAVPDLARAMDLGHRLLRAVAETRGDDRSERAHWVDATRRGFTLLHNAYEAARRALTYLRWAERDAAEIVPSLFTQRPRRRRKGPRDPVRPAYG